MVNMSLQPVSSTNIFNALQNGLNQWAALKEMHQRHQLNQLQNSLANAKLNLLKQQPVQHPQNTPPMQPNPITNFLKNPMMGSRYSGSGGTYVNPETGQVISSDTTPMATTDQTAISAVDRVAPQLNNLIAKLPQFQNGWKNTLTSLQGFSNRWLGSHYDSPSERASGLASLETAPEALLKAYGLRPSEYALHVMKETIKPRSGEASEGYRQRIVDTLSQLSDFKQQSMAHLRNGLDVTSASATTSTNPIFDEINRRKQLGQWP